MSTKRRFTEKEIAQIFEDATRSQNEEGEQQGTLDGLSLDELKQIGASTGIDPKHIIRAAAALTKQPTRFPVRQHLGIPIGVSRSILLEDTFSDSDWEKLVIDLRKTFKARGKTRQEGNIREWWNGNLHAYVEPTSKGFELRLETKKQNMLGLLYAGVAYIFVSIVMLIAMSSQADIRLSYAFLMSGLFMITGIGMATSVIATQPRWASKRERQMEAICKRAVSLAKYLDEDELALTDEKFLSLEDEEELNQQLQRYAMRKKASRS